MRKLFLGILLIGLALGALAGGTLLMGDALLLRLLRQESPRFAPLRIELRELRSHWFGGLELVLGGLHVEQPGGFRLEISELRVASPANALKLYRAFKAGHELPLKLSMIRPQLRLPPSPAGERGSAGLPREILLPLALPIPARVELEIHSGELAGPMALTQISSAWKLRLSAAAAEAEGAAQLAAELPGSAAALPISLEAKLALSAQSFRILKLEAKLAGLQAGGTGEFSLRPLTGKLSLAMEAPDLGAVSFRPQDLAAVGLTARPSGSLSWKAELGLAGDGGVQCLGIARIAEARLPLALPGKSLFSGLLREQRLEGPVALGLTLPFRYDFRPENPAGGALRVENASASLELSEAALLAKGLLDKTPGVPLRASFGFSLRDGGLALEGLQLIFHRLQATGAFQLPAPLGSALRSRFDVKVASLSGFPRMLPPLQSKAEGSGASLAEASGSFSAAGELELEPARPAAARLRLRSLTMRGLRLPLHFANEKLAVSGLLAGSASARLSYLSGDLNAEDFSGSFDLGQLAVSLPGRLEKKRGRKLRVELEAKGNTDRVSLRKAQLTADGLQLQASGSAAFSRNRTATLDLSSRIQAELEPLREYLPAKPPLEISSGRIDGQLRLRGSWIPEAGLEKSPLGLSGTLQARLGRVQLPEPAAAGAPSAHPSAPLLPAWPVARGAELEGRIEIAELRRGALEARGIQARASLRKGNLEASGSIGALFGGRVALRSLRAELSDPKLPLKGEGSVEKLDLSAAAGFVDPSYAGLLRGSLSAQAGFQVPDLFAPSLLAVASSSGSAGVQNAYLSTASFDALVNEKLRGIPGVGDKAKLSTGGLNAEIRTRFRFADSTAQLSDFVAITPRSDEMRLGGTLNLGFDADLAGEAHLADAPVRGSFREANSDPEGRLVVPVRFHGNLKNPQADLASHTIEQMLKKTAAFEAERLRNRAVEAARAKARESVEGAVKDAAGGFLDQLKKGIRK